MNTSLLSLLTVAGFLTTASAGTPGAILQPDGRVIEKTAEATSAATALTKVEAEMEKQEAKAAERKERALRRADEIRSLEYMNYESSEYRSQSPFERQVADTNAAKMMLKAGIPAEEATYYIQQAKLR